MAIIYNTSIPGGAKSGKFAKTKSVDQTGLWSKDADYDSSLNFLSPSSDIWELREDTQISFFRELKKDLTRLDDELRSADTERDTSVIAKALHGLKGVCGTFGMCELEKAVSQLSELTRIADDTNTSKKCDEIKHATNGILVLLVHAIQSLEAHIFQSSQSNGNDLK